MTELQVLSRVLNQKSLTIIENNSITDDYFITYPEEYHFIKQHKEQFGNVPDKETFLARFPNFQIVDVQETDDFLVDTFNEEHLYSLTVPIINKVAELVQTDTRVAMEYLQTELPKLFMNNIRKIGTDIIKNSNERLVEYNNKKLNQEKFFIPTGFRELDNITGGLSCSEELVVIFARTGVGKSWVLIKILQNAWVEGNRVALLEPEMSANKTGYRFDTLNRNFSNMKLLRGIDEDGYDSYIEELKKKDNPFYILHPKDFGRKVSVSKLKNFCKTNKIDILGIDGISYLYDERKERGDNRSTMLTNISEDLMDLSIELGIPVLVVCQSNRDGAKEEDSPNLENIRDSDGIAYNASLVISAKQKEEGLQLSIKKNRNGKNGDNLIYTWDIDRGTFNYLPSHRESDSQIEREYTDGTEVF